MANKKYWSVCDVRSIIQVFVDIHFSLRIKMIILAEKNFSALEIKIHIQAVIIIE